MPERNYEVGYGKPPKANQFPPGVSGNPKGRKKSSRGLKTDLRAELHSKVPVTENGKTRQLTKQQLVLKAMVTKAAKGDVKAAAQVLSMTMQMFGIEDERAGKSKLNAADEALLASYLNSNTGTSEPPPDWPAEAAYDPTPEEMSDITLKDEERPDDVGDDLDRGGSEDDEDDYPDVEDYDDDFDDDY